MKKLPILIGLAMALVVIIAAAAAGPARELAVVM